MYKVPNNQKVKELEFPVFTMVFECKNKQYYVEVMEIHGRFFIEHEDLKNLILEIHHRKK